MAKKDRKYTDAQYTAAYEKHGSIKRAAEVLKVSRCTVQLALDRTGTPRNGGKPIAAGLVDGKHVEKELPLPKKGIKRYLLTCAQSNTRANEKVFDTILGIKAYFKATLLISRFSYNKGAYLRRNTEKPDSFKDGNDDGTWYDPVFAAYFSDERLELAPGLVFCGELNILPTAVRPLSGLETYTGRKSSIVPHVKFAMESIASGNTEPAKINYTTGTVTRKNYIQKKEGQKAEFHHCYGALLVEVNADGDWWVRQLNADRNGVIYDIGDRADGILRFERQEVSFQERLEAVNWGDIHVAEAMYDPADIEARWGSGGMLDVLQPRFQFGHDTFSFLSRNHHDEKDSHRNFEKHVLGVDSVEGELIQCANFIQDRMQRDWTTVVIVDSNHDRALQKWLNIADYKKDPLNRLVFLELELALSKSIKTRNENFHLLEHALSLYGVDPKKVRFLREDESFVICRDAGGGIESGNHGHHGPNGAKGAPLALSKMGRRQNTGHTHSACIIDGVYVAGVGARPKRFAYRKGPSSWTQSDIATYPNGKRAVITWWNGRYRAA